MIHQGSCHCGKISFEVEGDFTEALDCNCSLCRRRGGLLAFVAHDKFKLTTDEDNLSDYRFNRQCLVHEFCATCGVAPFSVNQRGHGMVSVNLRCLPDLDIEALNIRKFDGRHNDDRSRATA